MSFLSLLDAAATSSYAFGFTCLLIGFVETVAPW